MGEAVILKNSDWHVVPSAVEISRLWAMSEAIDFSKVASRQIKTQRFGEGVMSYSNTAGIPSRSSTRRSEVQESPSDGIGLSFTGRVAGWSARHRWWVVAASIMVVFLAIFTLNTVEMKELDYEGEGDSARGTELIGQRFSIDSAPTEQLLFSNPSLDADTPAYRAAVEGLVQQLRALPEVARVASYYDTGDAAMLSVAGWQSGGEWNGSQSGHGASELGFPRPMLGKMRKTATWCWPRWSSPAMKTTRRTR